MSRQKSSLALLHLAYLEWYIGSSLTPQQQGKTTDLQMPFSTVFSAALDVKTISYS